MARLPIYNKNLEVSYYQSLVHCKSCPQSKYTEYFIARNDWPQYQSLWITMRLVYCWSSVSLTFDRYAITFRDTWSSFIIWVFFYNVFQKEILVHPIQHHMRLHPLCSPRDLCFWLEVLYEHKINTVPRIMCNINLTAIHWTVLPCPCQKDIVYVLV